MDVMFATGKNFRSIRFCERQFKELGLAPAKATEILAVITHHNVGDVHPLQLHSATRAIAKTWSQASYTYKEVRGDAMFGAKLCGLNGIDQTHFIALIYR